MSEYIERTVILNSNLCMQRAIVDGDVFVRAKDIIEFIESIPAADVVEVPCHCKDCRYNDPSWQLSADSIGCRYWCIYPDPDDWCCKAERKGGE